MEKLDKLDTRIRNLSIIMLVIAVLLLITWIYCFIISPERASPLLMSISIALLLGGILLFTRIQYVIWMKKRYK
jgi:hypothetical protein